MNQDIRNQIDKIRLLNERMGVPENTIPTVTQIYDDIIKWLLGGLSHRVLTDDGEIKTSIRGNYTVGGITYDNIELILTYKYHSQLDNLEIYRFSVTNTSNIDKRNDHYQMLYDKTDPEITIYVAGPTSSITAKDVADKLISNKRRSLGTFAHEMLHKHEKSMLAKDKKGASIGKYAEYNVYSGQHIGVRPLDQMLFFIYYTHDIEKITRPAELLAMLTHDKVTKGNFEQEVKNSDMYKQLVEMKNFNLDDMINSIRTDYVKEVENVFDDPGYKKLPLDKKIEALFTSIYNYMAQTSLQTFGNMIAPTPFDMFTGELDLKMDTINKQADKYNKHLKDVVGFFRKKQVEINRSAGETIKKLFKLYDQVPYSYEQQDSQNNDIGSLKEWELYHEISKTPKPEYKYKKPLSDGTGSQKTPNKV